MSFQGERISMFQHAKMQLAAQMLTPTMPANVQVVKLGRPAKLQKADYEADRERLAGGSAANELRTLYKETRAELANLLEREAWLKQVIPVDSVTTKKNELQGLLSSIEKFAAEKGVNLAEPDTRSFPTSVTDWKRKLESIKTASKAALAVNGVHNETPQQLAISNELEIAQKELLVKKMEVLYQKLRSLEDVIGDTNVFQEESVSKVLEREMEALQMVDKMDIQRNLKKVEFIVQELGRVQNDNKHNLLQPTVKKEVQDCLAAFLADFSEEELVNVSKVVFETVENIELRTDVLNKLTRLSGALSERRGTLTEAIRVAEENQEALRNLQGQTKRNIETLKANKRKIQR